MKKAILLISLCLLIAPAALCAQQIALLDSSDNAWEYFRVHYAPCKAPIDCTGQDITCNNDVSGYLGADEYQRYFRGWKYALDLADIPYVTINDNNLNEKDLSNYRVLILSNTPSISDENTKAIRQWVLRGGRLLATFGAGYKQIVGTLPQGQITEPISDMMKLQEGGTNGLHQLWRDPLSKVVTSDDLACTAKSIAEGDKTCCLGGAGDYGCAFVDVIITNYEGPTANLQGLLIENELLYGALGNIFVQRPETSDRVLAFLKFFDTDYSRSSPAIIVSEASKGRVVYFAFAPEFIVSLNYGFPKIGELSLPITDSDYEYCVEPWRGYWGEGVTSRLMNLMTSTVVYLLNN